MVIFKYYNVYSNINESLSSKAECESQVRLTWMNIQNPNIYHNVLGFHNRKHWVVKA